MSALAQGFAVLAAALHVLFFYMESILFSRPEVHRRFGVMTTEHAEVVRPVMFNQGFYNLFLATGVIVGVALSNGDGTTATAGTAVVVFGLACMALAGAVLALTSPSLRRAAAVQAAPPIVSLVLVALL